MFPAVPETELAALFAARTPLLAEDTAAAFWLGLLHGKLGRALWAAAALPDIAPPRPARRQLAEACPHRQALAVRGACPLRLATGTDHRRRACPDRGGTHLPVQGLSGAVLRGRNTGLRRKLRRLQPALGVRQRPCRRAGRRKAPLQPKTVTKRDPEAPAGASGSLFIFTRPWKAALHAPVRGAVPDTAPRRRQWKPHCSQR